MAFNRRQRGASVTWVLLLILFLCLAVGYWYWIAYQGKFGHVRPLNFNSKDYVAFLRQDSDRHTDLYLVKLDGTDERRMTFDGNPKLGLSWSPDGKKLCFNSELKDETSTAYQLLMLGSDGNKQITTGSGSKSMPQWRPDGLQIAFLVGGVLKVVKPNGDDMEQIYPHFQKNSGQTDETENSDAGRIRPPLIYYRWAPESNWIAAVQVAEGEQAPVQGDGNWFQTDQKRPANLPTVAAPETMLVLPAGGEEPTRHDQTNSNKTGFSWFADGKRIAATMASRTNQHGIGILKADDPRIPAEGIFTSESYTISPENPAVSPDGTQLAFEAWRTDSAENRELLGIAVISTDPSRMIRIKKAADIPKLPIAVKGRATNPQWSRDGTRLIYQITESSGMRDIWVAGADGSNPINLTKGKGDNIEPAPSPAK